MEERDRTSGLGPEVQAFLDGLAELIAEHVMQQEKEDDLAMTPGAVRLGEHRE